MRHFKNLSKYFEYLKLPLPEHPMFSVLSSKGDDYMACLRDSSPPIMTDFYSISLKKVIKGSFKYGRTKYDFSNGAMIFISPRQVMEWDGDLVVKQRGFSITFHEDFIKGTRLAHEIKRYNYFSYAAHEALHLSPKEEKQINTIIDNIEIEYNNNQDAFSKDIIISQLDTLLKYANRYYERQFINRKELSNHLLEKFNQNLVQYTESGQLESKGIPTLKFLAENMSVSQRYLSDTLKKETGKTGTEHIQLFIIDTAKNRLLEPHKSVSEIAYALGFEYPQYFSRLFKKKVGMSPTDYRDAHLLN